MQGRFQDGCTKENVDDGRGMPGPGLLALVSPHDWVPWQCAVALAVQADPLQMGFGSLQV